MESRKSRILEGVNIQTSQTEKGTEITVISLSNEENKLSGTARNITTWLLSQVIKKPINNYLNERKAAELAENVRAKDI